MGPMLAPWTLLSGKDCMETQNLVQRLKGQIYHKDSLWGQCKGKYMGQVNCILPLLWQVTVILIQQGQGLPTPTVLMPQYCVGNHVIILANQEYHYILSCVCVNRKGETLCTTMRWQEDAIHIDEIFGSTLSCQYFMQRNPCSLHTNGQPAYWLRQWWLWNFMGAFSALLTLMWRIHQSGVRSTGEGLSGKKCDVFCMCFNNKITKLQINQGNLMCNYKWCQKNHGSLSFVVQSAPAIE